MLCVLGSYNNRLGVLELTCTILWLVLFIRTCWFAHRLEEKKMKLKISNIHLVHSIQRVTWTPKRVIVCPAEIIAFKCGFEFAFVTSAKKNIVVAILVIPLCCLSAFWRICLFTNTSFKSSTMSCRFWSKQYTKKLSQRSSIALVSNQILNKILFCHMHMPPSCAALSKICEWKLMPLYSVEHLCNSLQ